MVVILFLSPMRMVINLCKSKEASKVSETIFIVSAIFCVLWVGYSIREWDIFIFSCNVYGVLIQTFYFFTFAYIKYSKEKLRVFGIYLLTLIGLGGLFTICMYIPTYITGWAASFCNTIMTLTPLQKVKKVCQTYDYNLFPKDVTFALFGVALVWLIYAICTNIIILYFPNISAIIVCTVIFLLNIIYKRKYNTINGIITQNQTIPETEQRKDVYIIDQLETDPISSKI